MKRQHGFAWKELLIVLAILAALGPLPQWHAHRETSAACASVAVGSSLKSVTDNARFSSGTRFRCGFDEKTGSGALVKAVGGWFPFGRDFCVVNVARGVVVGKHTVYGDVDHDCDTCRRDIRPLASIEPQCQ
jgi:hypothetical protein